MQVTWNLLFLGFTIWIVLVPTWGGTGPEAIACSQAVVFEKMGRVLYEFSHGSSLLCHHDFKDIFQYSWKIMRPTLVFTE